MTLKYTQQEVAVLGLLFEHHHYAYRLQDIMEKRRMDSWADIDYSTLSATLEKLETDALINSENRKTNNQSETTDENNKKVYFITDKGIKVLTKEIKSMLSEKGKIFYPFNLGLGNLMVLNDDEIKESLDVYLKSLEEQINYLEISVKIQEENKIPYNFISISQRSVNLLKAEKAWLKKFIKEIY